MKIVLLGGGTGGHFYPLMAVAEQLRHLAEAEKLVTPKLYYIGPSSYDAEALLEREITFIPGYAGKVRRYFSILNFFDAFKTFFGILHSIWQMYVLYPDVIFTKGGYTSFPTLVAARILAIPVVVHETDSRFGRANKFAANFAQAVAISYPGSEQYIPKVKRDRIALTGNPIREELATPVKEGAHAFLGLDENKPTIFITGGSLGAQAINEAVISALPELITRYQIIHQVGKENIDYVKGVTSVILENLKDKTAAERYKVFGFLNALSVRMAAGASNLVISRAGGSIFEIASWGLPSIIIPIPEDVSHDQIHNAFSYARVGGCVVIEQKNLTPHLLVSEIDRIMNTKEVRDELIRNARAFAQPKAAEKIAHLILEIALKHED
jgi:UDP-N-acetylglucosamine--N-acetylmuramyl-(pentapeptide) pyrophosphoryl-undecaprenol N-acetylglucosamine transferase